MPDVQGAPIRADRQHRRTVGGRHLGLAHELAGVGVDREGDDLVLVLQANVQSIWHFFPPSGLRLRAILLPAVYNNTFATKGPARRPTRPRHLDLDHLDTHETEQLGAI